MKDRLKEKNFIQVKNNTYSLDDSMSGVDLYALIVGAISFFQAKNNGDLPDYVLCSIDNAAACLTSFLQTNGKSVDSENIEIQGVRILF
jgi:hypothetical protein